MPIQIQALPKFPIDPANSAVEMQKLSDAVEKLQRTVADNFAPWPLNAPRPSLPVVVKITGTSVTSTDGSGNVVNTTLGSGWFTGKMQVPPTPAVKYPFDPAVSVDFTKLYSNKGGGKDDCYVFSPGAALPASGYCFGEFQGIANPSNASMPVRPVVLANSPGFGWFVLTGSATRYGTYTANNFQPATSQFDTGTASTFASSDIGTSGSTSVYLINVREEGKSTHDLDSGGSFLPLKFLGVFNQYAKDGKPCYLIDGRQGEACS